MGMGEVTVLNTMDSKIHATITVNRMGDVHLLVQSCQFLYVAVTLAGQGLAVRRDLPAKVTASMVAHAKIHQTPA